MKTTRFALLFSALMGAAALAQNPNAITGSEMITTIPAGSARDGFTLRSTDVMMTREGVTTKLEAEVILPNGLRVKANGNVTLPDGSSTTLRSNQLLTFAGRFREVALTQDGVAPLSSVSTAPAPSPEIGITSRDGITVTGTQAFITRYGITEKITSEVRLPNGVVAKPDGTITNTNGQKLELQQNQVLGLNGSVRTVVAVPNPGGPAPSITSPVR